MANDAQFLFRLGLESITKLYSRLAVPSEVYLNAALIKEEGHSDLIDCILYESALNQKIPFLTLDKQLIHFLEENGKNMEFIIHGEKFLDKSNLSENDLENDKHKVLTSRE